MSFRITPFNTTGPGVTSPTVGGGPPGGGAGDGGGSWSPMIEGDITVGAGGGVEGGKVTIRSGETFTLTVRGGQQQPGSQQQGPAGKQGGTENTGGPFQTTGGFIKDNPWVPAVAAGVGVLLLTRIGG